MIVYQSHSKIFTNKDYAPDDLQLDNLRLDFEEKDFTLEKDDFVCYVPGSMTLVELDSILEKHGFLFNYSAHADHTISRIFGENSYGLSSMILGLDLYHTDQSLSKTGGKVIKNVSGYDLAKLYLGSYNSFAIITGAYLRLEKLPEQKTIFRIYQELNELKSVNNTEFYKFVFDLCTSNYDNNYQAQVTIYKVENKTFKAFIELNLFAETEILELRTKKLKDKLEKFFTGIEILEHKEKFKKTYPETKQSIQIFSNLDNLAAIVDFLSHKDYCQSLRISPKESLIEVNCSEELLIALAKRFSRETRIRILPQNRKNLLLEKQYQKIDPYEQELIQKFKKKFDPKGTLNPGIM